MALNDRQKLFCEKYAGSLNASKAAVEAGYSKNNPTVTSTRIMKIPAVQEYIAKLQAEAAERNNVTVDEVIEKLRNTYKDSAAFRLSGMLMAGLGRIESIRCADHFSCQGCFFFIALGHFIDQIIIGCFL